MRAESLRQRLRRLAGLAVRREQAPKVVRCSSCDSAFSGLWVLDVLQQMRYHTCSGDPELARLLDDGCPNVEGL